MVLTTLAMWCPGAQVDTRVHGFLFLRDWSEMRWVPLGISIVRARGWQGGTGVREGVGGGAL